MKESCYCGRTGDVEDREPILDGGGRSFLRCPDCGHVDYLEWLLGERFSPLGRGETPVRNFNRRGTTRCLVSLT